MAAPTTAPPLSLDLERDDLRPYFLWDTTMTVGDLRRALAGHDGSATWLYWAARVMRDARYDDVWRFLGLRQILDHWDELRPRLGRERERWELLINGWRADGLVP
jgi:hypothetical protein